VRRAFLAGVKCLFAGLNAGGDVVFGVLGCHLYFLFSWMRDATKWLLQALVKQ
jgi:hypothetical protein